MCGTETPRLVAITEDMIMTNWQIIEVLDCMEVGRIEVDKATKARAAMKSCVAHMIKNSSATSEIIEATNAAVPNLQSCDFERMKEYAVYLGGKPNTTSYVIVTAYRPEMYPGNNNAS